MSSNVIRIKEVMRKTGLSRSSIYLLIKKGIFPKPLKLGARACGWLEDQIDSWINQQLLNTK